eukprot:358549-Chlamydomonas_euryale.AAC.1
MAEGSRQSRAADAPVCPAVRASKQHNCTPGASGVTCAHLWAGVAAAAPAPTRHPRAVRVPSLTALHAARVSVAARGTFPAARRPSPTTPAAEHRASLCWPPAAAAAAAAAVAALSPSALPGVAPVQHAVERPAPPTPAVWYCAGGRAPRTPRGTAQLLHSTAGSRQRLRPAAARFATAASGVHGTTH